MLSYFFYYFLLSPIFPMFFHFPCASLFFHPTILHYYKEFFTKIQGQDTFWIVKLNLGILMEGRRYYSRLRNTLYCAFREKMIQERGAIFA